MPWAWVGVSGLCQQITDRRARLVLGGKMQRGLSGLSS